MLASPPKKLPDSRLLNPRGVMALNDAPDTLPAEAPDTVPSVVPDGSAWSETLPGSRQGASVCICVDDVGLHPGVNGAATDLVLQGRVQALACRVGAPSFAEVVEHLARLRGLAVDVGLQIDLSEHPIDPQVRRPMRHWLLGLGRPSREALRREISAQFDAFEDALGHAPRFVAGHRHVHQLKDVRELVMAEMERRFAPGFQPWVRQAKRGGKQALPEPLRAWAAERFGAQATAEAARSLGALHNRALLGVYDFAGGSVRYQALFQRWLESSRDGELLVCHPSLTSVAPDPLLSARQAEYRVLSSPAWPALLERLDLNLQPMSRILAKRSRW